MTSGERMVFAAAFQQRLEASASGDAAMAARAACRSVRYLRALGVDGSWRRELDDEARAMVDDMLSNGGDR